MITLLILAVVAYVIFTISNDGVDTTVTVTKMSAVGVVGGLVLLMPFAYLLYTIIK